MAEVANDNWRNELVKPAKDTRVQTEVIINNLKLKINQTLKFN